MSSATKTSSRDVIARSVVEARRRGAPIAKPKYDEVDDLLDVVLETTRRAAERGADQVSAIATTLRGKQQT